MGSGGTFQEASGTAGIQRQEQNIEGIREGDEGL